MSDCHPKAILAEVRTVEEQAQCLFGRDQVEAAFDRMASAITAALAGKDPLFLCAMIGGVVPTGLLLPRLSFPLQLDYVHVTRYRGQTTGGTLHWLRRPGAAIEGRVVLVVDDVLDEGDTLNAIIETCQVQGAAEVYSAVLVDKRVPRHGPARRASFTGLEADRRYLFGYGMDYKDYLRNASGIFAVRP